MEPNNANLQKLEQDLQKLSQEAPVQPGVPQAPENITPPQTPEPQISDLEPASPPQEPKNGSPIVTIAIVLGVVSLLAIGIYAAVTMFAGKSVSPAACTMEAKICPDGSSVGRTGPNCEFAECPTLENAFSSATPTTTATPVSVPIPAILPSIAP